MPSVACRFDSADFAPQLQKMRQWLDAHQSHVQDFVSYRLAPRIVVVELDFPDGAEAVAFADAFDGEAALPAEPAQR